MRFRRWGLFESVRGERSVCPRFFRSWLLLSVCLVPAAHAQIGTPVNIGSTQVVGSFSTTLNVNTTQAVPAGASIIVIANSQPNGGSAATPTGAACSDSASHTYNTDASQFNSNAAFGLTTICSTHGLTSQLSSGATITVTWSGGSASWTQDIQVFLVTGLAGAPLDKTAANLGTSASPSSGTTAATAQANELLFGAILNGGRSASGAGFSPGSNGTANPCASTGTATYSNLGGIGSVAPSLFGIYCQVSATGAYTANGAFSLTSSWEAVLATYRGAATHFTVSAPGTATAGSAFSFTVTALNGSNTTATTYTGTVHFTSTDGLATLPADYTFTGADAGVHTFSATLGTSGSQTITATDTVTSSITGTSGSVTLTPLGISAPAVSGWVLAFLAVLLGGLGMLATRILGGRETP